MKMILAVFCILLLVPPSAASINVPVEDETYDILQRLEAEGVIQSSLLATRPLSRKEVARLIHEAEMNYDGGSLFIRRLIQSLKKKFRDELIGTKHISIDYIKPLDRLYAGYIYADGNPREIVYNNDGDDYRKGSNARLGFTSRAVLGRFSLFINPETRYSEDATDIVMKRVYGTVGLSGLVLELGKDSQWWGPGRHGSILLSNNPEPMKIVKLTNPHPVLLPWAFRYLGPFNFTFFATELGKERVVPKPYLWGMRFDFKPVPYVEIGLQRTALLGGEGRSEDLETWWESFTGMGENPGVDVAGDPQNNEAGDQRMGFDLKLTLPMKWQPVQIYAEGAGEDEAGGMPTKWAYLGGVYLPRILGLERLELRAEYANIYLKDLPHVWYNHDIYRTGYRYKGKVIGHHVGTDSRDLFFEMSYLVPEVNGWIKLSYDKEKHNLSGSTSSTNTDGSRPVKTESSVGMKFDVWRGMSVEGRYVYARLKDFEGLPEKDSRINLFTLEMSYNF
ncbi:MAG: capsule assembly Wzi family protein [Nitrospirae bacterium]|nr:capsule assembly Wzi family protein [Nitrospirota bacterium]